MDFFELTFGACPHGGIRPYCAQCTGDELEKKRTEKQQRREADGRKVAEKRASALAEVVDSQSAALDAANRRVLALQSQLNQARQRGRLPWRRGR